MAVEFHDPRGEPVAEPLAYDLTAELSEPISIALLSNGYPDAVAFLEKVRAAIEPGLGKATFRIYDKGDPTVSISDHMLAEIENECNAVISAFGH